MLRNRPAAAAYNMALDEALLLSLPRLQTAVLRFYSWTEPAASFGYFQKHALVETLTKLRPLVRRPTAGGIVPHDVDWTYSLAFPAGHEWYSVAAIESYRRVHEWLRLAFQQLSVPTQLAPCCLHAGPGQCFIGYEQYDLLWRGRKIAGAAQRRTRTGLLIQGSVQPPLKELQRSAWEEAMCAVAQEFGIECSPAEEDPDLLSCARELELTKYALPAFNQKR